VLGMRGDRLAMMNKTTDVAALRQRASDCLKNNRLKEALYLYQRVCHLAPRDAASWFTLAKMYGQLGVLDRAEECARNAISAQPGFGAAHLLLGMSLVGRGLFDGALFHFETAADLMPDNAKLFNNYGNALVVMDDTPGAIEKYRRAIELAPDFAEAHNNLGAAFLGEAQFDEAIHSFHRAIECRDAFPAAYNNLAIANERRGDTFAAIESYKKALALHEGYAQAHSNLLVAMNYVDYYPPQRVFDEHLKWARLRGDAEVRGSQEVAVDQDPDRPLRIGYVSGDFRTHSVSYFFEALLASHDSRTTHVTCYSDVATPDQVTLRIQRRADEWRHICGLPNADVAKTIRADRIDILVDLVGHTSTNRMELFVAKPAPIQLTYLGYPNTTGLSTMDYRITDGWADPPGETERYHAERLIRLAGGFLCYRPPEGTPDVADSPCERNGYITFGSFNKLAKITPAVVTVWSRLLSEIPDSRLVLKDPAFVDPGTRDRYLSLFQAREIDSTRLSLKRAQFSHREHLADYGNIDIALDTFPYNGTTTTCEALWMGVPVVTSAGRVHAGRVGVSLLSQLGRPMWIGRDEQQYVEIAKTLATAISEKRFDRKDLRRQVAGSRICDEKSYGGEVQTVFRQVWKDYCAQ
jgi:protein O-GlcNAc transferase